MRMTGYDDVAALALEIRKARAIPAGALNLLRSEELAAGGLLRKVKSCACGGNRYIQSQRASLTGALFQHHLTDHRGTRMNGAVLKDTLCRLFLVARGPADLMNADSGRSAHRRSRQNP